jgi:prepilin-type N-terminal cleavage/methylation domain-containing protein
VTRPGAERGFTLLEVAVAASLLAVLMGALFGLIGRTQDLEGYAITEADLRTRARAALERIVRELRDSGPSTFSTLPAAPLGASSLTFQRAIGYAGGAVVYGPQERIAWRLSPGEVDDGADDDGDGLVDEGQVVFIRNPGTAEEQAVVLCDGVAEYGEGETANGLDDNLNGLIDERGLSFDLDATGKVLTVRLTLARRAPDRSVVRVTLSTSVLLQNP